MVLFFKICRANKREKKKAEILRGRGGKKELNRKRGIEIKEGQN